MFTTRVHTGQRCGIAIILDQLDNKLADDLRTILADPNVIYTQVEKHAPEYFGLQIKASTASRHARGQCSCG